MSRSRGRVLVAALSAVVLTTLAGCGGGASEAPASSAGGGAADAAPAPAAELYTGDADQGRAAAGRDARGVTPAKKDEPKLAPDDRAIIYTGELTVRAKDVAGAAETAKQIVTGAGGRLDREESSSFGKEAGATLVFKVPPPAYPGVLGRLGKELGRRESLTQSTEDVTEQVADVESRLASAKAALEQLRTLLGRAKTIGEVLQVERQISDREADLESLQARQKVLAAQTSAATLTLRLVGPAAVIAKPRDPEPAGFLGGLKAGWRALVATTKVTLTVLGVILPWLIPLAVLWLLYRAIRRVRPARTPALAASAPAETVVPEKREE
ncbi:DUF4349 domain-containing protein [Sphaerisporangium rubeum]|uniref:DUF4349 domain-containing protein n=1 Tax=Sphaerisporangium rubeum TaxID=321317 RepID=A0A7X0M5W9_9ACTN|nr:DUF4349 domain-containing protein [Sphaerisporangium rubeum]MBB6472820.1 hypothetical protein [Sphaerisporangium rubeum]